jgi:hypothetical protein
MKGSARDTDAPACRYSRSVREMRADIVLGEILAHPELVERVEDIVRLPRIASWAPACRDAAVDDLVAAGAITEAADGRLCARPRRHEA